MAVEGENSRDKGEKDMGTEKFLNRMQFDCCTSTRRGATNGDLVDHCCYVLFESFLPNSIGKA